MPCAAKIGQRHVLDVRASDLLLQYERPRCDDGRGQRRKLTQRRANRFRVDGSLELQALGPMGQADGPKAQNQQQQGVYDGAA